MAFPRNPGEAIPQAEPGRRRNRRSRQAAPPTDPRRLAARQSQDSRHTRIAILLGGLLLLVVAAVIGVGYYQEFYRPPRVMAGEVRAVRFTMGDLVQRIRLMQGINRYQGGFVDLSTVPFEILQDMIGAEIIRQAAPGLGLRVTREDTDEFIRRQFYPTPPAGQETDTGQLDREFQEAYQNFLTATNLTDADYRVVVEENLLRQQLRALLGAGIESPQEQVEVEWVRLESTTNLNVQEVRQRLDLDTLAAVASDVGQSEGYADPNGYVGWVPRGAFPQLDDTLYGNQEKGIEPLAVGVISQPVATQHGIYMIRKRSGPQSQEVSDIMRTKLNNELVTRWQNEQQRRGSDEGWLKINFNSDYYSWVADQVRVTAPRVTVTPPPRQ